MDITYREHHIFKKGDRVCYKSHPDIYIGSIASDDYIDIIDKHIYRVFTSGDWFKYFAPYGGPNTLTVDADKIMLYKNKD